MVLVVSCAMGPSVGYAVRWAICVVAVFNWMTDVLSDGGWHGGFWEGEGRDRGTAFCRRSSAGGAGVVIGVTGLREGHGTDMR